MPRLEPKMDVYIMYLLLCYFLCFSVYQSNSVMSRAAAMSRGALIVLEGCDRCGKTTQSKRLVEALLQSGIKAEGLRFPDRTTAIGKTINDYLECKSELEDHAIHLLFAANRWEAVPKMKELLLGGTTLIVDRYSYSGVAFSSAKPHINMQWCINAEVGLPKPDGVIYLTLSSEEAAKRASFGGERYEEKRFQRRVADNYEVLKDCSWKVIDADKSIDDLHVEIKNVTLDMIDKVATTDIKTLWTSDSERPNGMLTQDS